MSSFDLFYRSPADFIQFCIRYLYAYIVQMNFVINLAARNFFSSKIMGVVLVALQFQTSQPNAMQKNSGNDIQVSQSASNIVYDKSLRSNIFSTAVYI